MSSQKLTKEMLLQMYRKMALIRRFEERMYELYTQGKIVGTIHPYIGQEASAVGVAFALRSDDYVTSTHRGHGHTLAKGLRPDRMMAELLGRSTGYCQGKGGSMHVADVAAGILGANGIVGAGLPIAVGAGMSSKFLKQGRVSVAFFGDGGANAGAAHESMNLASIWQLPVIFVCENNLYSLSASFLKVSSVEDLSVRGAGYNMPGVSVDGMDVEAVFNATREAVDRAREGGGPTFMVNNTYRFMGHSRGDPSFGPYRGKDEWESWKKRDPLVLAAARLGLPESEQQSCMEQARREIDEAAEFGLNSPFPEVSTAYSDIYV